MMSTYSVSVSVTASIPRQNSFAAEMGDKTPPYVPDYPEPSSKIVRTNSFFYQSLVRELSESSLLFVSSVRTGDKEWVSGSQGTAKMLDIEGNVFPVAVSDMKQNDEEGGLSNTSVEITMKTPDDVEGSASEMLEDNSSLQEKEPAEENTTLEITPMESPDDVSYFEMVKKRQRTPSTEKGQDEPTAKRCRTSASESDLGDEEVMPVDRVVSLTASQSKEMEPVSSKPTSEVVVDESEVARESEQQEFGTTLENTTPQDSEERTSPPQQNAFMQLAQVTQTVATVTGKCPMCGKADCPLDPAKQFTMPSVAASQIPILRRLQAQGNAIFSTIKSQNKKINSSQGETKLSIRKSQDRNRNSIKTPARRSPRTSAKGLTPRLFSHSPLQLKKLRTRLLKAVETGDLDTVKEVIQETGPSVRREKTGCTLLHVAASHNQVDVVMFLLNLISPNITNKEGQTPAHVAAAKGHTQVLRILMADTEFDPDKRDSSCNTVISMLSGLLFETVLNGDSGQIKRLVDLGADPDSFGGNLVNGMLKRELGVSTPRQLAQALNMESIVTLFAKRTSPKVKQDIENTAPLQKTNIEELRMSTRQFNVKASSTYVGGRDVYKMDRETRGRVYLLNLSSFEKRPDLDLPQLDYDARLLSDVFGNMGYACETYSGLTAQHTKQMLRNVREAEALSEAGCAIFIVSGYSVNGNGILTSDLKALDVDSVCRLFKDSECPGLKRKPKLFLFNLYHVSSVSGVSPSERPKSMRLEEPVSDTAVLFCKSFGLHRVGKGTGFSSSLCRTLADHAHDKELGDVYREFLTQYTAAFPDVAPELRYLGFTKKFFFNPINH